MSDMAAQDREALAALAAYGASRALESQHRREVLGRRCDYQDPGDLSCNDPGVPPCYLSGNDQSSWCEDCRSRQPHYDAMREQRRRSQFLRRKVERLARKLAPTAPTGDTEPTR